jgi:methenyltetrahydrofolate cyclohydrolase
VSATARDDQIAAFLRVLDPADTSTGGGTASAIAGALAAALVAMVSRLSAGPDAAEPVANYEDIAQAGNALAAALLEGADEDTQAFASVRAAYRLPKGSEVEVVARRAAIQSGLINAARVPLRNAQHCAQVSALVGWLEGRANPRVTSDLQCAAYLARAGLQGCLANVDINLPSIKDLVAAEEIRTQARDLRLT